MNTPTRLALALMSLVSFADCSSLRQQHTTAHATAHATAEQHQGTEQLSLQSQHDALIQGLIVTFDSVALTVTSSPTLADSVPPCVVNLIARKASIEKSDVRTVTYEGLNARRDTVMMREEKTEMETHEVQKENGGKPPNWTVIFIVAGVLALLIYMLWEKH